MWDEYIYPRQSFPGEMSRLYCVREQALTGKWAQSVSTHNLRASATPPIPWSHASCGRSDAEYANKRVHETPD